LQLLFNGLICPEIIAASPCHPKILQRIFESVGVRSFTGWMPLLSPNH